MKTIYEIKEILQKAIESIEQDMENPLNKRVLEYLEGKRNAYRTVIYYIDSFNERKIKNDLDEYFLSLVKKSRRSR